MTFSRENHVREGARALKDAPDPSGSMNPRDPGFLPIVAPPTAIVVATDFSPPAAKATAHAAWLAKASDARLHLVHVVEPTAGLEWGDSSGAVVQRFLDEARATAQKQLEALLARLRSEGVEATGAVRLGRVADEISREVAERSADLVVIGTRGNTGVKRLLAGSVAHSVADKITVPILLVH